MSPHSGSQTVVGLVGGVAAGKSTVAALWLEERSGGLVDADAIARRVLGRAAVQRQLHQRFPDCVGEDGAIDRALLARRVFGDAGERKALEAITHPLIRRSILTALERVQGTYALLDAPLLQETGLHEFCAWVVYVAAPARVRRRRAITNRGWTEQEWRAREASQWSCQKKRARADLAIDNSGAREQTRREVRTALQHIERA